MYFSYFEKYDIHFFLIYLENNFLYYTYMERTLFEYPCGNFMANFNSDYIYTDIF